MSLDQRQPGLTGAAILIGGDVGWVWVSGLL